MACAYMVAFGSLSVVHYTLRTMDLHDNDEDKDCKRLMANYNERIFFVDMCDTFDNSVAIVEKAVQVEEPIIVFYNVGVEN